MKAEKAVCPYCGAPISASEGKSSDTCAYCGMQYSIEGEDHAVHVPADREDSKEQGPDHENEPETDRPAQAAEKGGPDYWMPVGFRTKKIWKMILGGFFYLGLIRNLLGDDSGHGLAHRIAVSLLLFFWVSIPFSWQPLADTLPGLKSENPAVRRISKVGYMFLIMVILGQYQV